MKRTISIFLCVCLILTTLLSSAVTVFAEGNVIEGTSVTWSFNEETKELRFEGEGPIPDYLCDDRAAEYPWKDLEYTSVVFGEGITAIGHYAFCYSGSLVSVEIPDTVTVLGESIFYCCNKLETVKLPSSVTYVSSDMFSGCSSLKNVTFGENTNTIKRDAFYNCTSLETITLPSTLTTIEEAAFYGCALQSVVIPEGTTTIGPRVFYSCSSLTQITLPSTLTSIGNSAFDACMALTSIAFPDTIVALPDDICSNCRALTSVTLPANLTSIGDGAFQWCLALTEITIPATTVEFGEKSLGYGRYGNLVSGFKIKGYANSQAVVYAEENNIPFESVGYITNGSCGEHSTWEYVENEKTLYINGSGATYDYSADDFVAYNLIPYESIVIDEDITKIGNYAFYNAGAMNFTLLEKVESIGEKAIGYYDNNGTPALREGTVITGYSNTHAEAYAQENSISFVSLGQFVATEGSLGENITWTYDEETKVLTVDGTGATDNYTADALPVFSDYDIESVIVSDGIEKIGDFALYTNAPYNEITLGKEIVEIGEKAFGFIKNVPEEDGTLPGEDGTLPEEGTLPVEEDTLPEEGETTPDEIPFIANESLVVKGYISTPADDYANHFGFTFVPLDADELPFFALIVDSVIDHLNKFIIIYEKEINSINVMENFPVNDFIEVVAPEAFGTGAEFKLVNENGEYTYQVVVMGDCTGDGKINASDALAILQHSVQQNVMEEGALLTASDISHDNRINATDALIILQISVGMTQVENIYNPGVIR